MIIKVRLLNGLQKPLLYATPTDWIYSSLRGSIVHVPVRNTIVPAFVIDEFSTKPEQITFPLKDIRSVEQLPDDPHYFSFIKTLSIYQQVDMFYFIKRIRYFLDQKNDPDSSIYKNQHNHSAQDDIRLTDEQQKVSDALTSYIDNTTYKPAVLHGVTGSGKTEVYKKLILHAIAKNKTAILLLPEVTLATNFERRLQKELPHSPIFGFHSGKTPKEKKEVWHQLINKKPMLLIGVHLPVLLPIANLGIIIVDEEHEPGYQEKKHPKINSKETALLRAQQAGIPILLGSATPAISTLHNVKTKKWAFFQLKKRFSGSFPTISTVLLTENRHRKQFWISKELEHAIKDRLQKKEQIIIFLNRRGVSFFIQCKNCSFIFSCNNCSVSLTLHDDNILICHYCGTSSTVALHCPGCKSEADTFLKKGIGTQRVVTILQTLFPQARIARADHDISKQKKTWALTLEKMENRAIDILVGTQTITKGLHFPHVTLVGILWADLNLHFPFYNAAETTVQQLIQVAGRAGRHHEKSSVIVQTMADHEIFNYLNEIDYLQFYAYEIKARTEVQYPPCLRMAEIELKHINELVVEKEAQDAACFLHSLKTETAVSVLGPAKPPVSKIKKVYSRKIYLKGESFAQMSALFEKIKTKNYKSSIFFTPNPVN